MNISNYHKILKEFNVNIQDNTMNLNGVTIPFTEETARKLFNYMTEFSISTSAKNLLVMYYGLGDEDSKTLGEVSEIVGISDEGVRQNLRAAIRKAAHYLNKQRSYSRIVQEVNGSDSSIKV